MHSSGMRTVRSSGRLSWGWGVSVPRGCLFHGGSAPGGSAVGEQGCLLWGVSAPGVCVCSGGGGCLLLGCVSALGVSAPGEDVCSQGGLLLGSVCSRGMGVFTPGGCLLWGVPALGVSAPGGCLLQGVCTQGGVCFQGVSAPGRCLLWGVSALGGGIPACTEQTSPRCGQTHACKNITFATSLRTVNISVHN